MIETNHPQLSVRRQCELVDLNRATFYHQSKGETPFNLRLMRLIDEEYTRTPFYGYRKMTARLNRQGHTVNRKRVVRLMRRWDYKRSIQVHVPQNPIRSIRNTRICCVG